MMTSHIVPQLRSCQEIGIISARGYALVVSVLSLSVAVAFKHTMCVRTHKKCALCCAMYGDRVFATHMSVCAVPCGLG